MRGLRSCRTLVRASRSYFPWFTHASLHHRAGFLAHTLVHLSRTVHAEHFFQLTGIQDFLEGIVILLLRVEHFLTYFKPLFNVLLDLCVGAFRFLYLFGRTVFRSRSAIFQRSQILFIKGGELSQLGIVQHQLFSHSAGLHVHPLFRSQFCFVGLFCFCRTNFLWSVLRHHAATSQACSENQCRE